MTNDFEDLPAVGPATAHKLETSGFDSFKAIAVASPGELAAQADIGEASAADIIQAAREAADIGGFDSGGNVLERREQVAKIGTGNEALDSLLGGGVETQAITEIVGNESSGRAFLCHLLAVRAQLPEFEGGDEVVWVDTRNRFAPELIQDIVAGLTDSERASLATHLGIEPDDEKALVTAVLEQIHHTSPTSVQEQILQAERVDELAEDREREGASIGLVVVDSLTFHFRAEYQGRGEMAARQQKLNKHLHDLMRVGDRHNAATVVTNATTSNGDPYGGGILGHTSTFRIRLLKTPGEKRRVKLVDAPNLVTDGVGVYFEDRIVSE